MTTGKPAKFSQKGNRIVLKGLPQTTPDRIAAITVFKLELAPVPTRKLGTGCVVL